MPSFRFLHCADLHLDSPLRGLEADPDAPVEKIRGATREALRNMIDFAVNERVDFVVAAGDLYDGDWQDWRTGHFLTEQIARLTKAGIPFIAIRGNHDAASIITNRLSMRGELVWLLDHKQPETFRLPELQVAIHGQSFPTRAVTDNIALTYPPGISGWFNIGLLHSSVGERLAHDNYAPCSVDQLRAHDYDYWALGHVHEREILSPGPWIVFPGNLQGRHINEAGSKGATLVTVTDGRISGEPAHVAFDTVRWARISISLPEDADEDSAMSRVRTTLASALEQAEGRLLATRIILSGACAAHDSFVRDLGAAREKIRAEAIAVAVAGSGSIWTEAIQIATTPLAAPRERTDAIGQLIAALESVTGGDLLGDARLYAGAMLEKANALRAAIGEDHAAAKIANGDIPDDLRRRARDLLLGSLDL